MLLLLVACSQSQVGLGQKPEESADDTSGATIPAPATAPIYVHSGGTLYTWDPATLASTAVGDFTDEATGAAVGEFADIAIDADGALYGSVGASLYRIDPADASTTWSGSLPEYGTGLTFLPDGRLLVAGA